MNKKKKRNAETTEFFEEVVSATECTGLMPGMPLDEEERENYRELYDYGPGGQKK